MCKNMCPLDNPGCQNGQGIAERMLNGDDPLKGRCTMCDKKCSYEDLQCSTGQLMRQIKNWR